MSLPDNIDDEAMEYALALMDPEDRAAFQSDLLDDPSLADAVWRAEEMLAPLAMSLPPRQPSPRVARGLEARLFGTADERTFAVPRQARRSGGRLGLAFWRSTANVFFAATVAAVAVIGVLVARPTLLMSPIIEERVVEVPAIQPELVAGIPTGEDQVVLVRKRADGSIVVTPLASEPDTSRQLWLLGRDGNPISLGLLDPQQQRTFELDPDVADQIEEGSLVEVSVEPPGGSPTGRPTGEVLGVANVAEL